MQNVIVVSFIGLLVVACGVGDTEDGGEGATSEGGTTAPTSTGEQTDPSDADDAVLDSSTTTSVDRGGPNAERVPDNVKPVVGEVPGEILDEVLSDAAERSSVSPERLEVIRDEAVEWQDGSLGCPQPGEVYIQVIIPGYWVEVEAPDRIYDYRIDSSGTFRLCERQTPAAGSLGTTPITMGDDSSS